MSDCTATKQTARSAKRKENLGPRAGHVSPRRERVFLMSPPSPRTLEARDKVSCSFAVTPRSAAPETVRSVTRAFMRPVTQPQHASRAADVIVRPSSLAEAAMAPSSIRSVP